MRIATWNVNSLNVRLPHLIAWIEEACPDVICLQETKVVDEKFPLDAIEALGFHVVFSGQKTYNGVAILSRFPCEKSDVSFVNDDDPQRRLLATTIGDYRIVNVYVPNGAVVGSDKFAYKLAWLTRLRAYLQEALRVHPKLVLLGDFNIAPEAIDVHDPKAWEGSVLVSAEERAHFSSLLSLGLSDAFRLFHDDTHFSWWDYRANAFLRNQGLRIDHILLSEALVPTCTDCVIYSKPRAWERPSDHAPVMVMLR